MRYVNTIHGRVPRWRWSLKWKLLQLLEGFRRGWCAVVGHRLVPDVTKWYCVRCHRFID